MGWTYSLNELARVVNARGPGCDVRFSSVSTDTRTLARGDVFFALKGERFDGGRFVGDAFQKGAAAAVTTQATPFAPADQALYSHLHSRLDEGEKVTAETHSSVLPKEATGELIKRPFQIAHGNAFIHRHRVNLVEHSAVGGIGSFIAEDASWLNHPYRRLHGFNDPGSYRSGMGT